MPLLNDNSNGAVYPCEECEECAASMRGRYMDVLHNHTICLCRQPGRLVNNTWYIMSAYMSGHTHNLDLLGRLHHMYCLRCSSIGLEVAHKS
jgi:hypothetical protein